MSGPTSPEPLLVVPEIVVDEDHIAFGDPTYPTIARSFVARGAQRLHLRLAGRPKPAAPASQGEWMQRLVAAAGVPVGVEAAIDQSPVVERISRSGFAYVVLASAAAFDPLFVRWALDRLGTRSVVVELLGDGSYLFDPPRSGFSTTLVEAAQRLAFQGVQRILYRDMTGDGLAVSVLDDLCSNGRTDIMFAGPVDSIDDVASIAELDLVRLQAVLIGRPLVDGRIELERAIRVAARRD